VLRFEVSRSVITVQREFCARFRTAGSACTTSSSKPFEILQFLINLCSENLNLADIMFTHFSENVGTCTPCCYACSLWYLVLPADDSVWLKHVADKIV
jgi:hypothetical protein